MNRVAVFAFRVSRNERQIIADLAAKLKRSQSDAVRFVVIEAARKLIQVGAMPTPDLSVQAQKSKHEGENVTS